MEHCELQPQRHCSLVTKLVPHLTTREVCKVIPKEICVLKLVNPHPVKKPITLKWCTKKKPDGLPSYKPPKPATNSYLPPQQGPPQYQPAPSYRPHRREGGTGSEDDPFIITVDGEKYAELNTLPQDFNQILNSSPLSGPIRQVRQPQLKPIDPIEHNINTLNSINTGHNYHHNPRGKVHKRHSGPHHLDHLDAAGSDVNVHIVTPESVKTSDTSSTTTSEPLQIVQVSASLQHHYPDS